MCLHDLGQSPRDSIAPLRTVLVSPECMAVSQPLVLVRIQAVVLAPSVDHEPHRRTGVAQPLVPALPESAGFPSGPPLFNRGALCLLFRSALCSCDGGLLLPCYSSKSPLGGPSFTFLDGEQSLLDLKGLDSLYPGIRAGVSCTPCHQGRYL